MRTFILLVLIGLSVVSANSQNDSTLNDYSNSADRLLQTEGKLKTGGYAQVDYNQPLNSDQRNIGNLDVHRLVMLFGYRFNKNTQFVTELEYEHVKEVYVEQAFMQHKINRFINFRAGLLLIPMGVINEYHEPTTFNGVERPLVDKYISPTTWREIGLGLSGHLIDQSIKYQLYLVNGFNGYDGDSHLSGKNGLRNGRQKGAESYISSPNLTGKIEYYGIRGLNTGLSFYSGKSQSTMSNGIDNNDKTAITQADSSVVGITMLGFDSRYQIKGLQLRGQFYYATLSNTNEYNHFTSKDGTPNDLGSSLTGYYIEMGYNVFRHLDCKHQMIPFVRYEKYNTHNSIESDFTKNLAYNNTIITTGLTYKLDDGAALKADMQFISNEATDDVANIFNAGIGIMF